MNRSSPCLPKAKGQGKLTLERLSSRLDGRGAIQDAKGTNQHGATEARSGLKSNYFVKNSSECKNVLLHACERKK